MTLGGSAGHASEHHLDIEERSLSDEGGRVWIPTLVSDQEEIAEVKASEDDKDITAIRAILAAHPKGLTLSSLAVRSQLGRERVSSLLPFEDIVAGQVPNRGSKTKTIPGFLLKGAAA